MMENVSVALEVPLSVCTAVCEFHEMNIWILIEFKIKYEYGSEYFNAHLFR